MFEEWRAGSAPRAALRAPCPLRTYQLVYWVAHWSHWIFHWRTEQATTTNILSDPTPSNSHNNTSRADWNSKGRVEATGEGGCGQEGGCASLGSNKGQMLNHLTASKLVACESSGMRGTYMAGSGRNVKTAGGKNNTWNAYLQCCKEKKCLKLGRKGGYQAWASPLTLLWRTARPFITWASKINLSEIRTRAAGDWHCQACISFSLQQDLFASLI